MHNDIHKTNTKGDVMLVNAHHMSINKALNEYIHLYISKGLQCALTAITIVALYNIHISISKATFAKS